MSDKIDRSGAGPCGPCLLPLEALQPPPVASTTSPFRNREMMEKTSPGNASSAGLSIGSVSPKFQSGSPKTPVTTVEPLVPPTRVAVVGAGPVGLWIAVLLARAHARFFQTSSGFRISRHPQAPVINVFERRADSSGWGSRRVVLAMSNASQDTLNSRLLSRNELCARHCFSPTCSINLIESVLRQEFEKYTECGFGALHMGCQIEDPEALLADHDVVFVATGRNWPCDQWREGHGFQVAMGRHEEALILKFTLPPGPELQKTVQEARSGVGRFEVPGQPMYILRPGASEDQGWLWIMGLSPDVLNHIRSSLESRTSEEALPDLPGKATFTSFLDMWNSLTSFAPRRNRPSKKKSRKQKPQLGPNSALTYLDQLLRPLEVAPRVTLACFWHSNEVVEHVHRGDLEGWIVLVGDAACGKPFYLGTNLNGHFQDAMSLLSAPWTEWPKQGETSGSDPFKRYVSEYRKRISESQGFRKCARV